ncbi:hypothetical protein ACFU95_36525, partial [Streptomyces sp. NPDC057623]
LDGRSPAQRSEACEAPRGTQKEGAREAMVKQGKSIIRVTPETWGPVATGGFPARLVEGGA